MTTKLLRPTTKTLDFIAFYSLISQIRKSFPRTDFEGVMRHLKAERHARGVSCWQQFVSMLFCQLGRPHGLRETEQGLRSCVTIFYCNALIALE